MIILSTNERGRAHGSLLSRVDDFHGGESLSFSLDTDGAVDDLRPVVAAMNSFLDGTDGEAVIESLAVSDGVIKEARCNSSPDHRWVLVDSGATQELKVLLEDELPPRGTQF